MIRAGIAKAVRTVDNQLPFLLVPGDFTMSWRELLRLKRAPRYTRMQSRLLGRSIEFTDALGYLFVYREVLLEQIYLFASRRPRPLIVDCGANVGLSVIYFKHICQDARVIAFEADPQNFAALERNVQSFRLADVTLHQRAVWYAEGELRFKATGTLGSRVTSDVEDAGTVPVAAVRLKDFLSEQVDFLKLDIEGAEREVLLDCAESLWNVERVFVEYHENPGESQGLGDVLRVLAAAGFRYHLRDAYVVEHPFIQARHGGHMPLQLNIFGYRPD